MKRILRTSISVLMAAILLFLFCGCNEIIPVMGKHVVEFESNGGSHVDSYSAKTIASPPITQRNGYIFGGWYLDSVLAVPAVFPLTVSSDMTLYAKWVKSVYTVSFKSNGGTFVSSEKTDLLTYPPTTTRSQYEFDGWYTDSTLRVPASFPLTVNKDMTLYAKWFRTAGNHNCQNIAIKFLDDTYRDNYYFSLRPNNFDYIRLSSEGYKLTVTVRYDVYYRKDYNVFLDVGYAGSPKYEISLTDGDGRGTYKNDIGTSTTADSRSITLTVDAIELLSNELKLKFSTDNVQNVIFFNNICVYYEFTK